MTAFLPYGTQSIGEDDIEAVAAILRSGHLTQGPAVAHFESALAEFVGARYCVAFSNATAALHCSVKALEIPPGMNGITSTNTFVASSNCMAYNSVKPVFADIDPRTFNVTEETLRAQINSETKVLIPVHFAGQACDMERIARLAAEFKIPVIEDASHAIGSSYSDGSPVGCGKFAAMTVFSFHPVKTMTTGEGGAVTTNNLELYQKLLMLRSHGIVRDPTLLTAHPGPWYYEQQTLGFNYRLTDIQCALGSSQLKKLPAFRARRREIISQYDEYFASDPHIIRPFNPPGLESCRHLYVLNIDFASIKKDRKTVMEALVSRGVGTQVHYIPVHTQPWYQETFGYRVGDYPVAESYYAQALSIPLYPAMSDKDVAHVATSVKEVVKQ